MASAVDSAMVARVKDKFPVTCSSVLMKAKEEGIVQKMPVQRGYHLLVNFSSTDSIHSKAFPGGLAVKGPLQCRTCRRCGFDPRVRIPWRMAW